MKDHHDTGTAALTPGASPSQSFRKAGFPRVRGLFLGVALAALPSAPAATVTWTNVNGGVWSDASSWSPNRLPTAGDDVSITLSGTYTVTLDLTTNVNSLTLGGATGQQALAADNSAFLTLNAASVVRTNGTVDLSSGSIAGPVRLTINGTMNWSGGNLPQQVVIGSGGQLVLTGSSGQNLANCALTNYGTVTWATASGGLSAGGASGTQIANFGLWDAQTDRDVGLLFNATNIVFYNFGTFRKSGGTGTTSMDGGVAFNNGGSVDVRSGTLLIGSGGTGGGSWSAAAGSLVHFEAGYIFTAGSSLNGAGNYTLTAGTFTLPATITSLNVQMSGGTLTGANVLNGKLTWIAGDWSGATPMIIASNSLLVLTGSSGQRYANGVFTNFGTVTWASTAGFNGGGPSGTQIYNYGLWDAQSDIDMGPLYNSMYFVFNNLGTFRKSAGTGTTSMDSGVAFNNGGAVDVRSGTLLIGSGGTGGGAWTAAAGSLVDFEAGYIFSAGSSLNGAGNYTLTTGTFTLPGTITSLNAQMKGGNLTGANVLNGKLTWIAGDWSGATPMIIASNSLLVLTGSSGQRYANGVFTNFGTVTWTSTASFTGGGALGSQIYNYGLWDAQSDIDMGPLYNSLYFVFNNLGTFRKSAGTGTTTLDSGLTFNNTGLLDLRSGNIVEGGAGSGSGAWNIAAGSLVDFQNGYSFNPGSSLNGSGRVSFSVGTFNLPGTITCPNVQMTGASLTGANTLNGTLAWLAGTCRNASPLVIGTNSLLVMGGTTDHDLGNCIVTNFGTVTWTGTGNIQCGLASGTWIYNFGLWDAQSDQNFIVWYGSVYAVFNNFGTFRKSAGVGSTTFNPVTALTNSGTLDVQTAHVVVNGTYSTTGSLNFGIASPTNFGQLNLPGPVGLSGIVSANFNNSGPYLYPSLYGSSFPVLTYASATGFFSGFNLPPANAWWRTSYGSNAFSLIAIPVPPGQASLAVTASTLWADTGLRVTNSQTVLVLASGTWNWDSSAPAFGPDGDPGTTTTADLFYAYARHGQLIAYLGPNPFQGHSGDGTFFPQTNGYWAIGSSNAFTADKTGELWLGFNDDAVTQGTNDNTGLVMAQVSILPSRPIIQMLTREAGTLLFDWATVPGRGYQVQYTTNLAQQAWMPLAASFLATNLSALGADAIGPDRQRFYRVAELP